jgi:hypothetical protein
MTTIPSFLLQNKFIFHVRRVERKEIFFARAGFSSQGKREKGTQHNQYHLQGSVRYGQKQKILMHLVAPVVQAKLILIICTYQAKSEPFDCTLHYAELPM